MIAGHAASTIFLPVELILTGTVGRNDLCCEQIVCALISSVGETTHGKIHALLALLSTQIVLLATFLFVSLLDLIPVPHFKSSPDS